MPLFRGRRARRPRPVVLPERMYDDPVWSPPGELVQPPEPEPSVPTPCGAHETFDRLHKLHESAFLKARRVVHDGSPLSQLGMARALVELEEVLG